jgi:phage tail sheath protein FI
MNVAAHQLGIGPVVAAQSDPVPGNDGAPPTAVDLQGSRLNKTGLFALEEADLFNILILPNQTDAALQAAAIAYAEERRAFALLDVPATVDTVEEAQAWLTSNAGLRHRNAAAYFPRVRMPDPLQNNRVRSFANSGAVAGIYARTDADRGVWKAPAGTEAQVRGAQGLDYALTDPENGVLNPLGLNSLRVFPAFGPVSWGARTLVGSDALASEWKYVPVRRLALLIEESLYRGTHWVVFEPNDEPLWSQIRLNVGAFMQNLFRQGAFQGRTPREAYFVKCDSTTTTQDDINLGIVNIMVGFAPLKPAEFVIIKLQQLAGQAGAGA